MVDQEEIHNQCLSDNPKERIHALEQLSNFFSMSNKEQAWNDLHRLTNDEDSSVRHKAAFALSIAFSRVPDKQQAWNDLIRLNKDKSYRVRIEASIHLYNAFSHVPDKEQAFNDLIRLTKDKESYAKMFSFRCIGSVFSKMPDKQQAWNELHRLTDDEDPLMRFIGAEALSSFFSHVPDKEQAWNDLHRLINDENSFVRERAADALCSAFSHVPDKQQAWNELHRLTNQLTNREYFYLKSNIASALGPAFSTIPDKQQAWNDLHRLTNDEENSVRWGAAEALGSAFSHVPDKEQAWNDLHRLANDEECHVRTSSKYSLGRVYIFKASQAETDEDYKKELEKAIDFFEISTKETNYNPAQFCLPFYRSFYTIIFGEQKAKEEINEYLRDAEAAIEGSKSKNLLFEAIKNLANALAEVQNLENLDLEAKKGELNFCRQYCDRAAELMREIEEEVPYATAAMRKGLPILDRNLKELIEEIQNKAKIACQVSQGTPTQEIACAVNREVQKWEIGNQEEMTQMIEILAYILEEKISAQPKNQYILGKIDLMKSERNLVRQYEILAQIIPLIRNVTVVSEETVKEGLEDLKKEINKMNEKFEGLTISLKLGGLREELVISKGLNIAGSGAQLVTTIPLAEMNYPEINIDLEKVKEEGTKLSELPKRFVEKIKGYLP